MTEMRRNWDRFIRDIKAKLGPMYEETFNCAVTYDSHRDEVKAKLQQFQIYQAHFRPEGYRVACHKAGDTPEQGRLDTCRCPPLAESGRSPQAGHVLRVSKGEDMSVARSDIPADMVFTNA